MTVAFFIGVLIGVFAIPPLVRRLLRHLADGTPDPALHIRPPRPVVDTERRSDFRPERYAAFVKGRSR